MATIKYIQIPMNFTTTPHMNFLIKKYGYSVLGRVMALIVALKDMNNVFRLDDEMDYLSIKDLLRFDNDADYKDFINSISKISDFKIENNILSSKLISDTHDKIVENSRKASENANARWNKVKGINKTNAPALLVDATRLDKTRLDEIRTDEIIPDEIQQTRFNEIQGFGSTLYIYNKAVADGLIKPRQDRQ